MSSKKPIVKKTPNKPAKSTFTGKPNNSSFKKKSKVTSKKKNNNNNNHEDDELIHDNKYKYMNDDDDEKLDGEDKGYQLPKNFDDEEIDEDEAFNAEDEEEYSNFFNKKSKNKRDIQEEDLDDDSEYMDISELLDDGESAKKYADFGDDDDDDEMDGQDDDDLFENEPFDDEDDDEDLDDEDEDEDDESQQKMLSLLKSLEKQPIKEKKNIADITESFGSESQYTRLNNHDNNLIDINDLLDIIPEGFDDLKEEINQIKDKQSIATPLSKSETAQIQRKITLEQVNKILQQWAPMITEQRRSTSVEFSTPNKPLNSTKGISSNFSHSKLNDEIKKSIQESQIMVSPDKDTNIDPNEEKRRLKEIIQLRTRMYYQELKSKRQKKIKSKKYHKILKKQNEKEMKKKEEELMSIDPEYAKHKQMKAEEQRILERMTLRHTNQSKFMKNVMKGGMNKDTRQSINQKNAISQEILLSSMNKFNDIDEDDEDDQEEEEEDQGVKTKSGIKVSKNTGEIVDENGEKVDIKDLNNRNLSDKERIQLKLQLLGKPTNLPSTGINAMKFMQKSLEKDLDRSITQRNGDDFERLEKEEKDAKEEQDNRIMLHKPIKSKTKSHIVTSNSISVEDTNNISNNNTKESTKTTGQEEEGEEEEEEDNPWVEVKKSKNLSKKEKRKQSNQLLVNLNNVNNTKSTKSSNVINSTPIDIQNGVDKKRKFGSALGESKSDEKVVKKNKVESDMSVITSQKQKEMLLEAFAKDDIEEEFQREKMEELESELPEVKATFVPGWGSWAGEGIQDNRAKREIAALNKKRKLELEEMAKKRLDAKNQRTIINEKAQQDGVSKYLLNKVPSKYQTKDQYESTLSISHGKDFNTRTAFNQLIKPKVSVIPGTYIKPLTYKDKENYIQKKKNESKKTKINK